MKIVGLQEKIEYNKDIIPYGWDYKKISYIIKFKNTEKRDLKIVYLAFIQDEYHYRLYGWRTLTIYRYTYLSFSEKEKSFKKILEKKIQQKRPS